MRKKIGADGGFMVPSFWRKVESTKPDYEAHTSVDIFCFFRVFAGDVQRCLLHSMRRVLD